MIDKSLNYGRHHIYRFLEQSKPFETVLDIGAGHGDDLLIAKSINGNAKLIAIEGYPDYAKELTEKGIQVYNLNIERNKLIADNESIDIVICNQILEHCKEVFWIFHEISRVLKIGGKIIIGIPNLASLHNRLLLLLGEQPTAIKNNSAHVRGYTKKDLVNLLESGFPDGYKLQDFGGSNYYPFPPVLAKPLARFLPNSAWGIFFIFEKKKIYQNSFIEYPLTKRLETNFYLGGN
jgi:2-polyprenyl-3-methyl-5-hydroxy-6-metoxy-1,4-benzoquinol methylase